MKLKWYKLLPYNNDLSNIQILCANCHMQAHNYSNTREAGATG